MVNVSVAYAEQKISLTGKFIKVHKSVVFFGSSASDGVLLLVETATVELAGLELMLGVCSDDEALEYVTLDVWTVDEVLVWRRGVVTKT